MIDSLEGIQNKIELTPQQIEEKRRIANEKFLEAQRQAKNAEARELKYNFLDSSLGEIATETNLPTNTAEEPAERVDANQKYQVIEQTRFIGEEKKKIPHLVPDNEVSQFAVTLPIKTEKAGNIKEIQLDNKTKVFESDDVLIVRSTDPNHLGEYHLISRNGVQARAMQRGNRFDIFIMPVGPGSRKEGTAYTVLHVFLERSQQVQLEDDDRELQKRQIIGKRFMKLNINPLIAVLPDADETLEDRIGPIPLEDVSTQLLSEDMVNTDHPTRPLMNEKLLEKINRLSLSPDEADRIKQSRHLHEAFAHLLRKNGFETNEIYEKIALIDKTVARKVIEDKLNSLDNETFASLVKLIDENASDDAIRELVSFSPEEIQSSCIKELKKTLTEFKANLTTT